MASSSPGKLARSHSDTGVHFTWLLSTEREDDLDMISEDDGDDAMVQLDEEYLGEMQRKAALRDLEREVEVDSDFEQLEREDRVARAEYDDGNSLISPRGRQSTNGALYDAENGAPRSVSRFHRFMHHVPCTTCCFPVDGSHHKDCDKARIIKNSKRFCAPNLELLRTLRVVKHVRIFRKILAGTSKASYYVDTDENAESTATTVSGDVGLGLEEESEEGNGIGDGEDSHDFRHNTSRDPLTGDPNEEEMDEYVVNEVTGERTKRRRKRHGDEPSSMASTPQDVEVQLNLEDRDAMKNSIRASRASLMTQSSLQALGKPSWPQRKQAAFRRVKDLAKETLANVKPGVITAAVNFPTVLAVAGGVGAHPYFGLNAAFWSALAATFFAGSRYTIAAPTVLLTSNLVNTVSTYGTFVLPVIALLAAIFIYTSVFTRAIEFMTFVPSMVTHGVTLGTALLLIIYQLKFALGLAGNIHAPSVPYYILEVIEAALKETNWRAVVMFAVSTVIVWAHFRWVPRAIHVAFILIPLGIATGWILDWQLKNQSLDRPYIETLGTRYGHVEFHPILMTHWQAALFNWEVVGKAMEVAFICIMESYSTAQMTYEITGKRFSKNHEMFSLATANIVSGLFGGMPTSVGVTRTLLNIRSGATSRAAGFINGISLFLFAITMTSFMRYTPMPVIACLQMTAAWRSVDTKVWAKAWSEDGRSTATSLITAFLCTSINPFLGLLIGIIISMSIFSRQLSKGHSELTVKTKVHRIQLEKAGGTIAGGIGLRGSTSSLTSKNSPDRYPSGPIASLGVPGRAKQSAASSPEAIPHLPAPRLARLREIRPTMMTSLDDLPASRTLSIRHAVAQLQPILDGSDLESPTRDGTEVRYNVVVYRISGVMTFINAPTHYETLKAITQNKGVTCLILNVRFLYYADYDGKIVLRNLIDYVDSRLDLPTYLVGVTAALGKQLRKDNWYKEKKNANLIWKLESDAFKDIQRRNAELIESGVATTSTIAPSPSQNAGLDTGTSPSSSIMSGGRTPTHPLSRSTSELNQVGDESVASRGSESDSTNISEKPIINVPPHLRSLSRRPSSVMQDTGESLRVSGSIPRSSPIGVLQRPTAASNISVAASVSSHHLASANSPSVYATSSILSSTAPPAVSESVPILPRSNSKSLAARHAIIGLSSSPPTQSSSAYTPNTSSMTPSPGEGGAYSLTDRSPGMDYITTEELELAVGAAAKSYGLDPAQAVASTEAILRANRVHRSHIAAGGSDSHLSSSYHAPLSSPLSRVQSYSITNPSSGLLDYERDHHAYSTGSSTAFEAAERFGETISSSAHRSSSQKTLRMQKPPKKHRQGHVRSHTQSTSPSSSRGGAGAAGTPIKASSSAISRGRQQPTFVQSSSLMDLPKEHISTDNADPERRRRRKIMISPASVASEIPRGLTRFHHGHSAESDHSDGVILDGNSFGDQIGHAVMPGMDLDENQSRDENAEDGDDETNSESSSSGSSSGSLDSPLEQDFESDHQIMTSTYLDFMSPPETEEHESPLHSSLASLRSSTPSPFDAPSNYDNNETSDTMGTAKRT